eukprot:2976734-Pleurochrysis_carterae.AAC.1
MKSARHSSAERSSTSGALTAAPCRPLRLLGEEGYPWYWPVMAAGLPGVEAMAEPLAPAER